MKMKRVLLSCILALCAIAIEAQVYLNEFYVRPQEPPHSEFFELYNSSPAPVNLDCYTLVSYYKDPNDHKGFYVLDLPNITLPGKGFFVASSRIPFSYQVGSDVVADYNWNDPTVGGTETGGATVDYRLNATGDGYEATVVNAANPAYDIFRRSNGITGNDGIYMMLLFKNGVLVDGLLGASTKTALPKYISDLPDLNISYTGAGCGSSSFTVVFNTGSPATISESPFLANVPPAAGTDNGYLRRGNGPCPDNQNWEKSSSPDEHTPGLPNPSRYNRGQGQGSKDQLNVAPLCLASTIGITVSGNADLYPVQVSLYANLDTDVRPEGDPLALASGDAIIEASGESAVFVNPGGGDFVVVVSSVNGCFVQYSTIQCPAGGALPVTLKTFNARRNKSNVQLTWETATEVMNRGFQVERRTGNKGWETIAFVDSKAEGGNSTALLAYAYNDVNTYSGITQYRLRQVDMDGKATYSEIRSVRGEQQGGRTIIYPNPSSDGTVNVVFEEEGGARRDIFVTDMSGRILKQWRGYANNSLQVNNLGSGVYTIRIVNNETGTQIAEKLIVNKR